MRHMSEKQVVAVVGTGFVGVTGQWVKRRSRGWELMLRKSATSGNWIVEGERKRGSWKSASLAIRIDDLHEPSGRVIKRGKDYVGLDLNRV